MRTLAFGSAPAPLVERGDDLYETPACAVHALMRVEKLPKVIWEPSCGRGAIVKVLRAAGHSVVATDLNDYGLEDSSAGIDFLMEWQAPPGCECIVTNPPYKIADEYVEKALKLVPKVVLLLRTLYIAGQRRAELLDGGQLARIYQFANRLPMMHRDGWTGKKASSQTDHAWFVWDRSHRGGTKLERIRWTREG